MLLDTPIGDFGWKATDFTLKDPDGKTFTMSQHLGEHWLFHQVALVICDSTSQAIEADIQGHRSDG